MGQHDIIITLEPKMAYKNAFILLTLSTAIFFNFPAHSSIVSTTSELNMSHNWLVNSGNSPQGIEIFNLSSTLVTDTDYMSTVDDADFTNNRNQSFQVGNPFSDPPLPVLSAGSDTTVNLATGELAAATYNYSITSEDDPSDDNFDITRRDIEQSGMAIIELVDNLVEASAWSSHIGGRSYRFDNVTNDVISFNISGLFEAQMSASYDGEGGYAQTTGGFDMLFDLGLGAMINYFPVAPYLLNINDDDPGAFVSESFLANSGGINGISFNGSATATGDGGDTLAELSAQSRYVFTLTLDGGASVLMETGFRQSNAVMYTPEVSQVSAPGMLSLFLFGLLSLVFKRSL
jgi:hypothetical protein